MLAPVSMLAEDLQVILDGGQYLHLLRSCFPISGFECSIVIFLYVRHFKALHLKSTKLWKLIDNLSDMARVRLTTRDDDVLELTLVKQGCVKLEKGFEAFFVHQLHTDVRMERWESFVSGLATSLED